MTKVKTLQMAEKTYKKPHPLTLKKVEDVNGELVSRYGMTDTMYYQTMFKEMRKNLKLTQKQLSNRTIEKYIRILNEELIDWVIQNPEGVKLPKMGYFIVSKQQNKLFFSNVEERIEYIKNSPLIPEHRKEQIIKKYKFPSEKQGKIRIKLTPYITKLMWFNKRNIPGGLKAQGYRLYPLKSVVKKIHKAINNNVNYYQHRFNDYYAPFYKADQ